MQAKRSAPARRRSQLADVGVLPCALTGLPLPETREAVILAPHPHTDRRIRNSPVPALMSGSGLPAAALQSPWGPSASAGQEPAA
jgi:hypothetical protein